MKAFGIFLILWSLVFVPTLWIGLMKDAPSTILEALDVYLLFVFLPVLAGVTLIALGVRQGRRRSRKQPDSGTA